MEEIYIKFVLKSIIIVFLFFALINLFMITSHSQFMQKEGLVNNIPASQVEDKPISAPNTTILQNKSDGFCEHHRGSSHILEQSCGKLTQGNCNSTSCCVWTSNNKCVAGKAKGPTFNTDDNGKTKNLDYYYYQNKCYGPKCP